VGRPQLCSSLEGFHFIELAGICRHDCSVNKGLSSSVASRCGGISRRYNREI
jgi:hypothetical protein